MSAYPAQPQRLHVGTQRQEIMFKDGTTVHLLPVDDNGVNQKSMRAMRLPSGMTLVVDLAKLVPQLGADLCAGSERDAHGLVFYNLRLHFATKEPFVRQVCEHGRALVELKEAA